MKSEIELGKLANGLRVAMLPCEAESIAFGLFVSSGSRHETAKTAGISHFIEHMLFKGTATRTPIQITQAIEGRGGNFNACTGEEGTCYYAHMPDDCLEEAVDVISDMYLNATIPDDEFVREKGVVLEEIKMYADEPDSVAMENLQRNLFPGSALGAPVAGGPASLVPLRPVDLRRYIRTHYLPCNTIAVVVGNFDPGRALRIVSSRLGAFRRSAKAPTADNAARGRVVREQTVRRDVQQTQIALGYRTFGLRDPRKYAASVFDALMGRGMSSRLFQEIREKRGLSYDVSSRMHMFSDAGAWTITAGVDPGKAAAAVKTVDRELARICARRVSAAELRRTKEFMIGNFRLSHEKVTSKLFFCGSTLQAFGRIVRPEEQIDGIRAVTADDVRAVAQAIIRPEMRSLSMVVPKEGAERGVPVVGR